MVHNLKERNTLVRSLKKMNPIMTILTVRIIKGLKTSTVNHVSPLQKISVARTDTPRL